MSSSGTPKHAEGSAEASRSLPSALPSAEAAHEPAALERQARKRSAVLRLAGAALGGHDAGELLRHAVAVVEKTLSAEIVGVFELSGDVLLLQAGVGWPEGSVGRATVGAHAETPLGFAMLSNEPLLTHDLEGDGRFLLPPLLAEAGAKDALVAVLRGTARPLGVLCAHTRGRRQLSRDDARFLQGVADVVAGMWQRVQAETALHAREQALAALADHAPDIISRFDRGLRHTYVNRQIERATGLPAEAFLGKRHAELGLDPGLAELWESHLRAVFESGRPAETAFELATPSGPRVYQARLVPELAADGSVASVLAVGRDVTEPRRQELLLRESEALFRSVFVHSAVGLTITTPDGVLRRVNAAFAEMLGHDEAELAGRTLLELTHPEDALATARALADLRAGRVPSAQYEKRYVAADGRAVWALVTMALVRGADDEPLHFVSEVVDLTERKRAEEALHASQQRYRRLLANAHDLVLSVDASGLLLFANRACEVALGFGEGELEGRHLVELVAPDERERYEQVLRNALEETSTSSSTIASVLCGRDGRRLSVEGTLNVDRDASSVVALAILRDVTEQRELERQLLQSQKMEAVGRLAGGVAHDFNNLLTVIHGYTEFIGEDAQLNEQTRADLREIKKAAERASGLTRQLLAFSRKQLFSPKPVDLNAVLSDIEPLVRRLVGEDIHAVALASPERAMVFADAGQLEQVVMNLVVNARDAMPKGGTLTLELSTTQLDQRIAAEDVSIPAGPYVVLTVSDTGVGMDAATQARIFEPFFTTKPQGQGTGLGLSTAYGIVKQSGGFIAVESEPGAGTSFRIYLPQRNDLGALPRVTMAPAFAAAGAETILLVEDEEAVRSLARRILQRQGYRVLVARHGADGLRIAATHDGPIDLVVTDLVMPEMNGRELAERLHAMRKSTRVLFMSGYTDDDVLRRGLLQGGEAFLQKPFKGTSLARAVRQVLDDERDDETSEPSG